MQLKTFSKVSKFCTVYKACKAQCPYPPETNGYFSFFILKCTSDRFYDNCKGFSLSYEITYLGKFLTVAVIFNSFNDICIFHNGFA